MLKRLTLALLTVLCGCSTTATVSLRNGQRFEAKIRRGTQDALVIKTGEGWEVPIPREEISNIDHPGNTFAVAGVLVGALGFLSLAKSEQACGMQTTFSEQTCFVISAVPLTLGASMLAWGLTTWLGSTRAVRAVPPSSGSGTGSP